MNNRFNVIFPVFDLFNQEFSPGFRIVDSFSNCFSFHLFKRCSNKIFKFQSQQLDNLTIVSSSDSYHALVVTDASIKNNVAISITHIHICDQSVIKTIHHTVNVLTIEAELFSIRCGINQATNILGISKIIIITDSLHATWRIFDSSVYLCHMQVHLSRNYIL